jgi:hypothetical protein
LRHCGALCAAGLLVAQLAGCSAERSLASASAGTELPVLTDIAFVKEMRYVPEVDSWQTCPSDSQAACADSLLPQWRRLALRLAPRCTPELLQDLSSHARSQMAGYRPSFAWDSPPFVPVTCFREHRKLVYAAPLERLPSHQPGVTRKLMAYVLYDPLTRSILRVTVTIRGARDE